MLHASASPRPEHRSRASDIDVSLFSSRRICQLDSGHALQQMPGNCRTAARQAADKVEYVKVAACCILVKTRTANRAPLVIGLKTSFACSSAAAIIPLPWHMNTADPTEACPAGFRAVIMH